MKVKNLLHEAFHANLIQKAYSVFGSSAINLWNTKPEEMTFIQLMDYIEMKAIAGNYPFYPVEHHSYMAANFGVIRDGLKTFSSANNPNHSDYNDFHFAALAYHGLKETSYYTNSVIKNPDGSLKTVTINGHELVLENVHNNFFDSIRKENIPCN